MDEMDSIIVLTAEDGEKIKMEFLDLIEYGGNDYVVLLPTEFDEEDLPEAVVLMIESSGKFSKTYSSVDDEDTLKAVFEIFKERSKDKFNFID